MQKSTSLRNELVIKGTRIGVWDWNIQTGETYFNERWAEIIGYTLEELQPISIETWMKFAHPDDLEESNARIQAHFAGEEEYYDFESRMKHKEGHWVWVHDRGKVFDWTDKGEPLRMCGSHIDITKQKELEFNLIRAISDRDVLLKEVHHRVKNNLQLLLSLARLKDKDGWIQTQEIEDSINSIASAYEAIYKTDRLEKISFEGYVNQILKPILSSHRVQFVSKMEDFETNIDFLIPIGLVMTELLNNSLKHAFKGVESPTIQLTTTLKNELLYIEYSDNGNGYDERTIQKLDDLDSFGINIIQGLVRQMDGTIELLNRNGACAIIKLEID